MFKQLKLDKWAYIRNRHPTEKITQKPTPTHTHISLGTKEKRILRYLYDNPKERFNLKNYSRKTGISRSSVYDTLNQLESKELIKRELANNKITKKGIDVIEFMQIGGVGSFRRECRKKENLSTHYHKFRLPISDNSRFSISRINKLSPISWHENKLHNLYQIILKFEDATVIINPKQLVINLYDISTEDVDESDFKCLSKAIKYAKDFMQIGIITEGIMIEEGHWARVESALSDFLYEKVDNRYFLDLGDGIKFWIDHSHKREDETNDKLVRKNIDNHMADISMNKHIPLSDLSQYMVDTSHQINEISHGVKALVTFQQSQIPKKLEDNGINKKVKPEYIG